MLTSPSDEPPSSRRLFNSILDVTRDFLTTFTSFPDEIIQHLRGYTHLATNHSRGYFPLFFQSIVCISRNPSYFTKLINRNEPVTSTITIVLHGVILDFHPLINSIEIENQSFRQSPCTGCASLAHET